MFLSSTHSVISLHYVSPLKEFKTQSGFLNFGIKETLQNGSLPSSGDLMCTFVVVCSFSANVMTFVSKPFVHCVLFCKCIVPATLK